MTRKKRVDVQPGGGRLKICGRLRDSHPSVHVVEKGAISTYILARGWELLCKAAA